MIRTISHMFKWFKPTNLSAVAVIRPTLKSF